MSNVIDLTSPEAAIEYLKSLDPDEVIEIPDRFQRKPRSAAQEALLVAFEVNCADLVSRFGYEIDASTALATLRADRIEERERLNW